MKSACASFEAGSLPNSVSKPLPKNGQGQVLIEPEIRKLAFVFRDLQNMRHLADYDPSERFERSEVLSLIDAVEAGIRAFEGLAATDSRHFFLVCLLTWKEWLGRPG
jgi:hypothetical protein